MAVGYGVACPKPARGTSRRTRLTKRLRREKAFRDAVWDRARDVAGDAYCKTCGRGPLLRTLDVLHPQAGHVAHIRGRWVAPADRCNPDAAMVQCRDCHMASHSMRFA